MLMDAPWTSGIQHLPVFRFFVFQPFSASLVSGYDFQHQITISREKKDCM